MDTKTFKHLLKVYSTATANINRLKWEIEKLWYDTAGVKGVRYDKERGNSNQRAIEISKLAQYDVIDGKEKELAMWCLMVDVIEERLSRLSKEDKDTIMKVLVQNRSNEEVGNEKGYTSSGMWKLVERKLKRIL